MTVQGPSDKPDPEGELRTVVVDATVVISLAKVGRLGLLGTLSGWLFIVPDQVVEEVTYPDQAEALRQAILAGHLRQESSTAPTEMALYAELRQRMGKGEAACLAMAASRGWHLASDDCGRAFRRLVREQVGQQKMLDTAAIEGLARDEN